MRTCPEPHLGTEEGFQSLCKFGHHGLAVGELPTGEGGQTVLLLGGHVPAIAALDAFDAYTLDTAGWPISQVYPHGRIEHAWAITRLDHDGQAVVELLPVPNTQTPPHALPVTCWTDEPPEADRGSGARPSRRKGEPR